MSEMTVEAVQAVVEARLTEAGFDVTGEPYGSNGAGEYWPLALELRDRISQAIMAEFGPRSSDSGAS